MPLELIKSDLGGPLNIRVQKQLLKEARDIFLPRLMMGVIDVEEIV